MLVEVSVLSIEKILQFENRDRVLQRQVRISSVSFLAEV
jgi:hypothetical protein